MVKSTAKTNLKKPKLKEIIIVFIVLIVGVMAGGTVGFNLDSETGDLVVESDYQIELTQSQIPALVENSDGTISEIDVPTLESVDGGNLNDECPDGEECGRGWWVDTSSPNSFKQATIGQCIDTDGYYGSQCWDLANLFWQNTTGRNLSTWGTGAAKGTILDGAWQYNAGNEFEMIWDADELQAGDIVVFTNGQWGHIGMAMGDASNGYIALLGTNQGGTPCNGGGSSTNIINISLKNFGGAFRYKEYIKDEPVENPLPISNCVKWHVLKGDTMSKIMLECENTVKYGEAMDAYAKTWYSLVYKPGQSVYDGWHSASGVGLYAGDDIEHRTGE